MLYELNLNEVVTQCKTPTTLSSSNYHKLLYSFIFLKCSTKFFIYWIYLCVPKLILLHLLCNELKILLIILHENVMSSMLLLISFQISDSENMS